MDYYMDEIYVFITRHAKKQEQFVKFNHGDYHDIHNVSLSSKGHTQHRDTGEKELRDKGIESVYTVSSEFLRTDQAIDDILFGANLITSDNINSRLAMVQGDRNVEYTKRTSSDIGIGGMNFDMLGVPDYGENFDKWAEFMITNHYLSTEKGNPNNYPVLAKGAAGIMNELAQGIEYLASHHDKTTGAIVIATHTPILDSFANTFTNNIDLFDYDNELGFSVKLKEEFEAHKEGEYIFGKVEGNHNKEQITLNIKGNNYEMPVLPSDGEFYTLKNLAKLTAEHAMNDLQKVA